MTTPDLPDLRRALDRHFGFPSFRGRQEEVVQHVLAGGDALVIMATGEGKSLCYQLPALVADGLTLVVSPLIALMDDQVAALQRRGLPATCIHSMLDRQEREQRLRAALEGQVRLLYVTPERFRVPGFLERIRSRKIALLAVDEAHCVSHWGHDFRPDYRELGEVRRQLGNPPCLALTATATPEVQADIRRALHIEEARLFHTGVERPNLFLSAASFSTEEDKLDHLLSTCAGIGGPGIVYTALIVDLLRLETEFQRRGLRPLVYHGKLSANERREQQERFLASDDAVVLATNAFGMGVDKPDIRFILHYQIPGTLEQYYQEVGRAGRDGLGSFCELLYFEPDLSIQRNFVEWANPTREFMTQLVQHLEQLGDRLHAADVQSLRETFLIKNRHDGRVETCLRLLRTAGCLDGEPGYDLRLLRAPEPSEIEDWLPADKHRRDLEALLRVVRYAGGQDCRKHVIHTHFGFPETGAADGCGACDRCAERQAWLADHLPQHARKPLPRLEPDPAPTGGPEAPLQRGDWIEVRGHGPCAVVRVHRHKNRLEVDVERARDLQSVTLDLRRVRWRRVQG